MISNMDISGGLDIVRGNESSIAVKWYIGGVVGKVTSGDGAVLEVNKVRVNGNIRVTCVDVSQLRCTSFDSILCTQRCVFSYC